jgi:hypothetical protein
MLGNIGEHCECGTERLSSIIYGVTCLKRRRRGWEDNIRMDIKEFGVNAKYLIDSFQDMDNIRMWHRTSGIHKP